MVLLFRLHKKKESITVFFFFIIFIENWKKYNRNIIYMLYLKDRAPSAVITFLQTRQRTEMDQDSKQKHCKNF